MLQAHGHDVVPVHPALPEIDGIPVAKRLGDIEGPIDTVTVYVRPELAETVLPEIIALNPGGSFSIRGRSPRFSVKRWKRRGFPALRPARWYCSRPGSFDSSLFKSGR